VESPSLPPKPSPGHAAAEPGAARQAGQVIPGTGLAAAYELARAAALGQRADGFRHGLAVIRGKGVAAWMAVQAAGRVPAAVPTARPASTAGICLSGAPAGPIVTVLAAMTLAAATAQGP